MRFSRYRITTAQGEVFSGVTDKDGKTMSVHTLLPGALRVELPESENWISFFPSNALKYEGIKCTATMGDGTVLQGEFDSENKASFYSFAAKNCIKFEVENLDFQADQQSGAENLLKKLSE
jgi:type VI secretion system secreted protein VgrG